MKRSLFISILLAFCLLLSSCSGPAIPTKAPADSKATKNARTEPAAEPGTSAEPGTAAETEAPGPSGAVKAAAFRAYLAYLKENKETTCGEYYFAPIGQRLNIFDAVMFWDISGDGLPEMLVISPGQGQSYGAPLCLRIFGCPDGQLKELTAQGENCVIPVFWDQTFYQSMTDSVCFSVGDTLYVYSICRENGSRYERESESVIKLGYDRRSGGITTEKVFERRHSGEYGPDKDVIADHWYADGWEITQEKYEEAAAKLFAQAEKGILVPLSYAKMWTGSRASESVPQVFEKGLGMRYRDALSFLTEAIEAAEEEPPCQPEIILFGRYEQDNNGDNGPEPIEWLVLAREEGRALVISRLGLSAQYYDAGMRTNWERSSLRGWLDTALYATAFTEAEREKILTTQLVSEADPDSGQVTVTGDRLFLLSNEEAAAYLTSPSLRVCLPSAYAEASGCRTGLGGGTDWFLRSYGGYGTLSVSCVDKWGSLNAHGTNIDNRLAVRPAMWILTGD